MIRIRIRKFLEVEVEGEEANQEEDEEGIETSKEKGNLKIGQ
jgi:hypothetical protein